VANRLVLILALGACLGAAGCGGDEETRTVTVNRTVTAAAPDSRAAEREAILDAVVAYYAADETAGVDRGDLRIEKTNRRFADVVIADEAHAILKKARGQWIVLFDGNGVIPQDTVARFGIPPEYARSGF
jgi:ABC-type glycerol-3-phosphate transport system substrate-binding protein